MKDALGRTIDYLRVSITDRCNLRCRYCTPEDLPLVPHADILRYEEFLRVTGLAARLGITAVRVTGGEPFARRGCVGFLRSLKALPGISRVTLTTNGVLLGGAAEELAAIGVDGVNVSLDSLDPKAYLDLTGRDALPQVLDSLERAVGAGLRVKVNSVLLRGQNDGEIAALAGLAERLPVDVRFIELMPGDNNRGLAGVPGHAVLETLRRAYPDLAPDKLPRGRGPAVYWKSARMRGAIGFINAMSGHFCGGCNRVRVTSEGRLKLCLFRDDGLDLRAMLRGGKSDAELLAALEAAILAKPACHGFGAEDGGAGVGSMSRIGG